jgi:hypothetical protein
MIYASILLYRSDLFVCDAVDSGPDADYFNLHIPQTCRVR